MRIAFIGLGVMGGPMAGHLVNNGFNLTAFNRTKARADNWHRNNPGGNVNLDLIDTIKNADVLLSCIGKDQDVKELSELISSHANENTYWVDHTTTSATLAQNIFQKLKPRHIHFIDAPVSGGEAGAINGALTVMCGGTQDDFNHVQPIFQAYAKNITLIGEVGSGQLAKMVNQICLAGVVQGLSEGITFANQAGLDCNKVIEAISKGAAQSWQMDNRAHTMIEGKFDFGFAIDWMLKDLNICLAQANSFSLDLPATTLIEALYKKLQANGDGRLDTSALIKQFET